MPRKSPAPLVVAEAVFASVRPEVRAESCGSPRRPALRSYGGIAAGAGPGRPGRPGAAPPVALVVEAGGGDQNPPVSVVGRQSPADGAKRSLQRRRWKAKAAAREKLEEAKKATRTREEDEAKFKNDALMG